MAATLEPWRPPDGEVRVGGVFAALPLGTANRETHEGDPVWVGAVVVRGRRTVASAAVVDRAGFGYRPGYLALQVGPALERAVRALDPGPEVLLVNATGLDHPRGAGLALHLGALLGVPTVGVTDRPLVASGSEPGTRRGDAAPLLLAGGLVGYRVRTRPGVHPVAVHAAWRTDPDTALAVVLSLPGTARTPEPLRLSRRVARLARSRARGTGPAFGRA